MRLPKITLGLEDNGGLHNPPPDSLSQKLTLEELHNRCSFQLALALYHEATGTNVLTGGLQESPEYHTGNQFFSVTEFLSPKAPMSSPETFQERCRSLQRASEVLKKAQSDVGSEKCSGSVKLSHAAIIDARGRCSLALGRAQQALKWHQQAQQLRRELLPEGHISLGHSCFNCGLALAALGAHGDAIAQLSTARNIYRKQLGPNHSLIAAACVACARSSIASADCATGEEAYAEALDVARAAYGPGSFQEAAILVEIGSSPGLRACEGGDNTLMRGLQLLAAVLHLHHPLVLRTAIDLMQKKLACGKRAEAELIRSQFGLMRCAAYSRVANGAL